MIVLLNNRNFVNGSCFPTSEDCFQCNSFQDLSLDHTCMIIQTSTLQEFPAKRSLVFSLTVKQSISKLSPDPFKYYESLTNLEVIGNSIDILPTNAINSNYLSSLRLINNNIKRIDGKIGSLPALSILDLSINKLKYFSADFLSDPGVINQLNLSHNEINEIGKNMFKGCVELYEIYIDNNKLEYLTPDVFKDVPKIEILNLNANQLTNLNGQAFAVDMSSLKNFMFKDNLLMYLNVDLLQKIKNIKYMELGGNPWICDCLDFIIILAKIQNINMDLGENSAFSNGSSPVCVRNPTCGCNYRYNKNSADLFVKETRYRTK